MSLKKINNFFTTKPTQCNQQISNNLPNLIHSKQHNTSFPPPTLGDANAELSEGLSEMAAEIINIVKQELNAIDTEGTLQNILSITKAVQYDISLQFQDTKQKTKVQAIVDKYLEKIVEYLIQCLHITDNAKSSTVDHLSQCLSQVVQIINNDILILYKSKPWISSHFSFSFTSDEEFVTLINSLSALIKQHATNSKNCIKSIKSLSESSKEYLSKCQAWVSSFESNEKLMKEKVNMLCENIELLKELNNETTRKIKSMDAYCIRFYDEAKSIFKGLKALHNETLKKAEQLNANDNKKRKKTCSLSCSKSTDDVFSQTRARAQKRRVSPLGKVTSGTNINTSGCNMNNTSVHSTGTMNLSTTNPTSKAYSRNNTKLNKNTDSSCDNNNNSNNNNNNNNHQYLYKTADHFHKHTVSKKMNPNNLDNNVSNLQLASQVNELTIRNQELLQDIAKLHQTYLTSYYENLRIQKELDELKEIKMNTSSNSVGLTPLTRHVKAKSVGKIVQSNSNSNSNVNGNSIPLTTALSKGKAENLSKLSLKVVSFIRQMNALQEAIIKKAPNVLEMKKNFEVQKKEIYNLANDINQISFNAKENDNIELLPKNSITQIEELKAEKEYLISQISKLTEDNKIIPQLKENITQLKIEHEAQIKKICEKFENANRTIANLEDFAKKIEKEKQEMNGVILQLQEDIQKSKDKENIKHLTSMNSTAKMKDYENKINQIKAENAKLKIELNEKEIGISEKSEEINKFRHKISEDLGHITELKADLNEKESTIQAQKLQLEKSQSEMEYLTKNLTELKSINKTQEESLKQYSTTIESLQSAFESKEKKCTEVGNENNIIRRTVDNLKKEMKNKEEKIRILESELANLTAITKSKAEDKSSTTKEDLKFQLEKLTAEQGEKIGMINKLMTEKEEIKKAYVEIKDNLSSQIMSFKEKELESSMSVLSLKKEISVLNQSVVTYMEQLQVMNEKLSEINNENRKLKEKLGEKQEYTKNIKKENISNETLVNMIETIHMKLNDKYKEIRTWQKDCSQVVTRNECALDEEELEIKEDHKDDTVTQCGIYVEEIYQIITFIFHLFDKLTNKNLKKTNTIKKTKPDETVNELLEENKKLKALFNECTQTIFDAIKATAPNLQEEESENISFNIVAASNNTINLLDSSNSKVTSSNPVTPSGKSEGDFIRNAVEMFKKYNNEIIEANKRLEQERNEMEMEMHRFKIMAETYKQTLHESLMKMGVEDDMKNKNIKDAHTFTVEDLLENMNANAENNDTRKIYEKEIADLIQIQSELIRKLDVKEEEVAQNRELVNQLLKINSSYCSTASAMVSGEKYDILYKLYITEQEKALDLQTHIDNAQKESPTVKPQQQDKQKGGKKILTLGNDEDCFEEDGADAKKKKKEKTSSRKNDSQMDIIKEYEERENLLLIQLSSIKDEVKELREKLKKSFEENDELKRKLLDSYNLSHNDSSHMTEILKNAMEKLIKEITITPKIKELLTVILKFIGYNEEKISEIYSAKEKKERGGLFNLF